VDGSGNIYVADYNNNRIQKWAPGATSGTTVAGGNGAGSGDNQLNRPFGVFVDGSANVYVADLANNRIQKWAPGAASGTTVAGGNGAGSGANQLDLPFSVFVDGSANVYVADRANNRIQKFSPPPTLTGLSASPSPVCVGSLLTFTATVGNVAGSYSYTLTNGQGSELTGTASGTVFSQSLPASGSGSQSYTLTLSNAAGRVSASTAVTVNPLPIAGLINDGPLTCSKPSVTLTASGGGTYLFSAGATQINGGNTASVNTAGVYSVTVTSANGCTAVAEVMVSGDKTPPSAPALSGASREVNTSTSPLSLTGFVVADANNTLRFYGSSGLLDPPTASITTAGIQTFSAVQTNQAGCSSPATVFSLTVVNSGTPQPPLSQTVCKGSRVVLKVNAEGATGYQWFENGKSAKSQISEKSGVYAGTSTGSLTLVSAQSTANYFCRVTMTDGSIQWYGQYNVTVNKKCNARMGSEEPEVALSISLQANPIENGELRAIVRGAAGQPLTVHLHDLRGYVIRQQTWEQAATEQVIEWSVSTQSPGLYLLRAVSNGQQQTVKVLKP
jgi:hypothetical protein